MRFIRLPGMLTLIAALLLFLPGLVALGSASEEAEILPAQWEKVDEKIRERLVESGGTDELEFILRLSDQAYLDDVKFQRDEVVHRLKSTAALSLAKVRPTLEERGFVVKKSFWIVNSLLLEGPADMLAGLTTLPQVGRIVDNFDVRLVDGKPSTLQDTASTALTWGLEKVEVERVWSEVGAKGDGVRVCVSDTGVDVTHPDLQGKMWSDIPGDPEFPGGWIELDYSGNPVVGSIPHDTEGHGTHTSGTVVGDDASGVAIGMAPKATLMHALVLPGGGGSFSQVIAGIEWCVSPYDDTGSPAGQPAEIHSMSWGATGYYDEMVAPIRNSYFAGTLPVAAAGNCGEGCTGSPGNVYDALSIGASDVNDYIAYFSSGEVVRKSDWTSPPAEWPDEWVVPLISAPGVDVYSSLPGGGYAESDGTSMATPHVAGCAALMLSANPSLTSDEMRDSLVSTALWFNTYYPAPPDTRYGWGRLQCFAAVDRVAFDSGISGTVRDQADGELVDQAFVNITAIGIERNVESGATGTFRVSLGPGTYNVTVERFGYSPQNLGAVTVQPDQWVDLDVLLSPLPRGQIVGSAFNNETSLPVPGVTVSIVGIPITLASITDGTGSFVLRKVPEGSYEVLAASPYFRDLTASGVAVVTDNNTTVDFPLEPRDWVAVMGDRDDSLSKLLKERDYYVENPDWWQVINDPCRYQAVVVNQPYFPGSTTFSNFISATDNAGTGVIFLDTYEHTWTGGGIYYLWSYRSDPQTRNYGYDFSAQYLYYNVSQSHPILDPYGPGEVIVFENSTFWHDYAWFDLYSGENGTVIALAGSDYQGNFGPGIAVDDRANNRHVLMSLHGASNSVQPGDWTNPAKDLLQNAVNWSKGGGCSNSMMVDYNVAVSPPVGLWYETFQVRVNATNVGSAPGNYTARLYVDDVLQSEQTVYILPGEIRTVSFPVARDPVGTYRVSIGPHRTTFRVRPPIVTVQASDVDGTPISGATITAGLGTSIQSMGRTDAIGTLAFDSPAGSHGQYWVVIQALDVGPQGLHYFLAQNIDVEDDLVALFTPTINSTSAIDFKMTKVVPGQTGQTYIRRTDMPPEFLGAYVYPEGIIVVDPLVHAVKGVSTVETRQSTWTYRSSATDVDVTSTPSVLFQLGGRMQTEATWTQQLSSATVNWGITDAYGNDMESVIEKKVGILAANESIVHLPLLSLWNSQGQLLTSGYVEWTRKPAIATLPDGESLAFVQVELETGPYPLDNTFELTVAVLDSDGRSLPKVAGTKDTWVLVQGTALRSGRTVPVSLTVNDVAMAVDANGTFSAQVNLSKGLNTITVNATDLAGNVKSAVYVIQSKPDIILTMRTLPDITNVPQLTVEGMVELGANLTVNGGGAQPGDDGFYSVTLELTEGMNTIIVAAEDYIGNRKELSKEVQLDTMAPQVTVITPKSGAVTRDESITIVGRTEADASLTINGQPVDLEVGDFAYTAALLEGENTFSLEATDPAGNVQAVSLMIQREPSFIGIPVDYLLYGIAAVAGGVGVTLFIWLRKREAAGGTGEKDEDWDPLAEMK